MTRILTLTAVALLAAAPASADLGQPTKTQILACAGTPNQTIRRGEIEYMYYRDRIDTGLLPSGSADTARREDCETVVVLVDGVARTAERRKSSDLLRAQFCSPQVEQCIQ